MNGPSVSAFRKEVCQLWWKALKTPKPQTQIGLGSDETPHGQVASSCPCLSSLPFSASWRHYLRQEPYAVVPHVRICAGGAGQPASLPRPFHS